MGIVNGHMKVIRRKVYAIESGYIDRGIDNRNTMKSFFNPILLKLPYYAAI